MPWIESHTELEDHPKRKRVGSLMEWDKFTTIGRLHCFWWWCLKYAEDGDLRNFNDLELGESVGLNGYDCKKFVEAMVSAGFLEREPFFRIHDWMERVKGYLVSKYHTSNPKKLKTIVGKYRMTKGQRVGYPSGNPKGMPKGDPPNIPDLPNLTDQTNQKQTPAKMPDKPPAGGSEATPKPQNGATNGAGYALDSPIRKVVAGMKLRMGVPVEDRTWDKANFGRYAKYAKEILGQFDGEVIRSLECIDALVDYFERKKLDWSPKAVSEWAWKFKHGKLSD